MELNPLFLDSPSLNRILPLFGIQPSFSRPPPFLSIDAYCYRSFNLDVDNRPFFKLEELNIAPATSRFNKFHTLKPRVNVTTRIISKFHTLSSTTIHVPFLYNS
ncbi:hypothetical protein CY35_02G176700 [Sphagnum magellanicum]|nr:hypothetical protein CY35_02G176700 [Sphagnum magellanicum]